MIGARMLYLIQREDEMSYNYGPDAAYCIAGKQVRIPTPNGTKIFIQKTNLEIPEKTVSVTSTMNLQDIMKRIEAIQKKLQPRSKPTF